MPRWSCSSAPRACAWVPGSSRARTRPGWPTPSSRRRPTSTTRRSWPTSRRASAPRCAVSPWKPSPSRSDWRFAAGGRRPRSEAREMKIGVLALQGDFAEHAAMLDQIGVEPVEVRLPAHLEGISGLCLPGGECTTMRHLIDRWALREPLLEFAATGAPIFGTCAGMIILARDIADGDAPVLPLLDVTVRRNAFGRQLDSFEGELTVPVMGDQPVRGVFIRALVIERVGPGVDVLATLADGRIVAVRQRNVLATAFHPELAGEARFHRLVATMAAEHDDPGEGSGRRHHPTRRAGLPG